MRAQRIIFVTILLLLSALLFSAEKKSATLTTGHKYYVSLAYLFNYDFIAADVANPPVRHSGVKGIQQNIGYGGFAITAAPLEGFGFMGSLGFQFGDTQYNRDQETGFYKQVEAWNYVKMSFIGGFGYGLTVSSLTFTQGFGLHTFFTYENLSGLDLSVTSVKERGMGIAVMEEVNYGPDLPVGLSFGLSFAYDFSVWVSTLQGYHTLTDVLNEFSPEKVLSSGQGSVELHVGLHINTAKLYDLEHPEHVSSEEDETVTLPEGPRDLQTPKD